MYFALKLHEVSPCPCPCLEGLVLVLIIVLEGRILVLVLGVQSLLTSLLSKTLTEHADSQANYVYYALEMYSF